MKQYGVSFDPYLAADHQARSRFRARCALPAASSTTGFTVDTLTGLVTFATAPASSAALTAGFLFDVPVRCDTDKLDIELTSFEAADAPAIPLIEVRE